MAPNKPRRRKPNSLHAAILANLSRSKQSTAHSASAPSPQPLSPANPSETQSSSELGTISHDLTRDSSSALEDTQDRKRKKTDPDRLAESAAVVTKKAKPSINKRIDPGRPEHEEEEGGENETGLDEDTQNLEKLIRKHSQKINGDPSKLISEFHRIEKRLSQAELDPLTRHRLILQQKNLGGLEAYQTASKIGGAIQNGGETGKWCAQTMIDLGLRPSGPPGTAHISLLDVGAIDGKSYAKYSDWIATTSIDINPIDESIVARRDFFQLPLPKSEEDKFDVVCLSLVLNFIGDLKKRGEMIKRARRFLKPAGNLFIVLPLACLNNSRYLDFKRFRMILNHLGFKVAKQHHSAKLTYWFLEKEDHQSSKTDHAQQDPKSSSLKFPKVQIRTGPSRNNFCIKV